MHIYIYINMYISIYIYIHIHAYIYQSIQACIFIYIHIYRHNDQRHSLGQPHLLITKSVLKRLLVNQHKTMKFLKIVMILSKYFAHGNAVANLFRVP